MNTIPKSSMTNPVVVWAELVGGKVADIRC